MNDLNAALRAVAGGWTSDPQHPAGEPEGLEAPPRAHAQPTAASEHGVKGLPEGTPQAPLTPSAADATAPARGLHHGDVVHWTSHRGQGYGQIVVLTPASVTIRCFLPVLSKQVTVARDRVTFVCTNTQLTTHLELITSTLARKGILQ